MTLVSWSPRTRWRLEFCLVHELSVFQTCWICKHIFWFFETTWNIKLYCILMNSLFRVQSRCLSCAFKPRLVHDFQKNIMFPPFRGDLLRCFVLGQGVPTLMLHLTQMKRSTWWDRDGNVYYKFNAPKLLQDCMLSVELKWYTNELVQWLGGGGGCRVGW